MLLIKRATKEFFSAFAEAGEEGLTLRELIEKLSKSGIGLAFFGLRGGIDQCIISYVHRGRLRGDVYKNEIRMNTGKFFITEKGLETLAEVEKPCECGPSCPAYDSKKK